MTRQQKMLQRILGGASDADISFTDLCRVLIRLGFDMRIRGDHHIFSKEGIPEIINLQPKGMLSKPYQVKQVRSLIEKYGLYSKDADQK